MVFHSNRLFSLLPLKNPLWKHTSFGKSLAVWRNLAATQIFLSVFYPSKCNAFFVWITYLQNKTEKGYLWHVASFFFKRVKPENFQFYISKTTSARGCKLSNHEKYFIIFHLWHSLPPPFSSVACSWTYVQLHKKL